MRKPKAKPKAKVVFVPPTYGKYEVIVGDLVVGSGTRKDCQDLADELNESSRKMDLVVELFKEIYGRREKVDG